MKRNSNFVGLRWHLLKRRILFSAESAKILQGESSAIWYITALNDLLFRIVMAERWGRPLAQWLRGGEDHQSQLRSQKYFKWKHYV